MNTEACLPANEENRFMRNILYRSDIMGRLRTKEGEAELHVVIDAKYDEQTSTMISTLDTFLCSPGTDRRLPACPEVLLPAAKTIKEHVSFSEALDVAKEIFAQATRKARDIVAPAFR